MTSINLGEYDNLLSEHGFIRVHRSHLINISYVKKLTRGKSPILIMEDGSQIAVANSKKEELLKKILE